MVKRHLNLYVDGDIVERVKERSENISRLVESLLESFVITQRDNINKRKDLEAQLKIKSAEITNIKLKLEDLKKKKEQEEKDRLYISDIDNRLITKEEREKEREHRTRTNI